MFPIKLRYIRVLDRKKKLVNYVHMEDIVFSESTRNVLRSRSEFDNVLVCGCRSDHTAVISFLDDGSMDFGPSVVHDPKCVSYRDMLFRIFDNPGLGGFTRVRGRLSVGFYWGTKTRPTSGIITAEDIISCGKRSKLSFSEWISACNRLAFTRRIGDVRTYSSDLLSQTEEVLFQMGTHRLSYKNGKVDDEIIFSDENIYTGQQAGASGLCYGKIYSISKPPEGRADKYRFVRLTGARGKAISFRVHSREFLSLYESLPSTENAWLCGMVETRLISYDPVGAGGGVGGSDIPIPGHENAYSVKQKNYVSVLKSYRLFCCNDAGMIVPSRRALELTNRYLAEGMNIYTPFVFSSVQEVFMQYRESEDDLPLLQ